MTLFEVYKNSLKKLQNPDVEEINIRILLCEINGLKTMSDFYIHKDEEIRDLSRYLQYFDRFLNGEPIQYILNKTTFLGQEFYVDKRVLIPRQESEEVVSFLIGEIRRLNLTSIFAADICAGSGVLGISLAKEFNLKNIIFSDISKDALEVTKINCEKHKISPKIYCDDALDELIKNNEKVNVLIANPPYIKQGEKVENSVLKHEPHLALFADDEFSVYKSIISNLNNIKKDTLLAVFELGDNDHSLLEKYVKEYCPDASYKFANDMNGKERILSIYLK